MGLLELFLLAVGLSMDAFAVAVCAGLTIRHSLLKKATVIGLYFGISQAVMPMIGYLAASRFAGSIGAYEHWVAFAVLAFLGVKMIAGSVKKMMHPAACCADRTCADEPCTDRKCLIGRQERSLRPVAMLPLAIATSIDALAVGVSFVALHVNIALAAPLIGVTTFILAAIGVKIGNVFGAKLESKAELVGGIILVLIGLNILLGHFLGG